MPKADIKTKKFCGIYLVNLSEGNFPNPSVSGELQASRLPRLPWFKIPRQILTSQTIIKRRIYPIFYHFSPMGTVPQVVLRPLRLCGRKQARRAYCIRRHQCAVRSCASRCDPMCASRGCMCWCPYVRGDEACPLF